MNKLFTVKQIKKHMVGQVNKTKQIEKYESNHITSNDYKKSNIDMYNIDLYNKFNHYRDKYIPKNIEVIQAAADFDKLVEFGNRKNGTIVQFCNAFDYYWQNIPVNEIIVYMKANNMTEYACCKSYYKNARKYSKFFK